MQRTRWLRVAAWFLFWMFAVGVVVVKTRESVARRMPSKSPVRWVRQPPAPVLPTVKVERVMRSSIEGKLTLKGMLEPASIETAVPQVNGRVVKVLTQPGKTVKSGEVVVQLDRSTLQADVRFTQSLLARAQAQQQIVERQRAEALNDLEKTTEQLHAAQQDIAAAQEDIARAEAALAAAQNRLNQVKTKPSTLNPQPSALNPQGIAAVQALVQQAQERATAAAARAKELRAAHEAAQQRVDELERQWQQAMQQVTDASELFTNKAALVGAADVRAPCDGTVTQVAVKAGDAITAGTPLVFVSTLEAIRVRLLLPPMAKDAVQPKMAVSVVVPLTDGREKELVGTVERIALSDSSVIAISVAEIIIPTQDTPVKLGEMVTCALSLGQKENVLTVPIEAMHQDGQTATVFVVEPSSVVHVRAVTLGWTDGSRYEVVEGLTAGEQVVIESSSTLREGDVVRVVD